MNKKSPLRPELRQIQNRIRQAVKNRNLNALSHELKRIGFADGLFGRQKIRASDSVQLFCTGEEMRLIADFVIVQLGEALTVNDYTVASMYIRFLTRINRSRIRAYGRHVHEIR